jgi:scyllo-inositol 2-dehydrogenase (NADP+)
LIIVTVLNVGLVGFGHAGSVFHAPLIAAEPRLRLAAVASSRPLTAEFAAARSVADPQQLVCADDIDVVVVASPNASHASLARAALLADKHVVVDKPFTLDLKEADALITLARERNRLLTVFQNRRWDGNFLTVQELLAQDALGEVYFAEMHFDRYRPAPKQGWREQPVPGAGALYDLGSHLIDQALCLFGMPDTVSADVTAQRDGVMVDDYFHVQLCYARRRVLLHASALVPRPGPRFVAHGTAASLFQYGMDAQESQLAQGLRPGDVRWGVASGVSVRLGDGAGERLVPALPGAYERFYHAVAAAALDGAAPPVSPAEARAVMAVLDAARRSAVEGVRIVPE